MVGQLTNPAGSAVIEGEVGDAVLAPRTSTSDQLGKLAKRVGVPCMRRFTRHGGLGRQSVASDVAIMRRLVESRPPGGPDNQAGNRLSCTYGALCPVNLLARCWLVRKPPYVDVASWPRP